MIDFRQRRNKMICRNCKNEIPEGVAFQQKKHKKRKRAGALKCTLIAAGIMLTACTGLCACGSSDTAGTDVTEESNTIEESASKDIDSISMIQTGYLGEFTDATDRDIFDANFGLSGYSLDWAKEEMDGSEFVGFHAYPEGGTINDGITVLFQICPDETFKVSGYAEGGNENFEPAEIADFLNNWYMNWYIKNRIGDDVPEEEAVEGMRELINNRFDKISGTAVLYGASKDYAGDRGNLGREIDGFEPISMTVTELINYYSGNMLDVYTDENTAAGVPETESAEPIGQTEPAEAVQGGLVYGTYESVTEDGMTLTATVSHDSLNGTDVISASALSSGGRYTGEFYGTLTQIEDSYYEATDEAMGTVITATFTEGGLVIGVWDTLYEEMLDLEGTYALTEAGNPETGGMEAVTEENVVDWFRKVSSGDYVHLTGTVSGIFNISGMSPTVVLYYYVDEKSIHVNCYLSGNASEINNYMDGDTVTVTGVFTGKNASGYGEVNVESISLVQ